MEHGNKNCIITFRVRGKKPVVITNGMKFTAGDYEFTASFEPNSH